MRPYVHLRRIAGVAATVGSAVVLFLVLVLPADPSGWSLLRLPIEGILAVALVLAVPARARTAVAITVGALLGVWGVLRVTDLGFYAVLQRPFDPAFDWNFLVAGIDTFTRTRGHVVGVLITIGVILLAVAVVGLVTVSMLRVARVVGRHRAATARTVGGLGVAWVVLAVTGAQVVPGQPIAARDGIDRVGQERVTLAAEAAFAAGLSDDPWAQTPDLLGALAGKDVLIVLVESYGRVAVGLPTVESVLADGDAALTADGFSSRSAYVTSPTVSGGSHLAFATLLSGAWVTNQRRYEELASSSRLTLSRAFTQAGWATEAVMPGVTTDWPEGPYYGFDAIHPAADFGYQGPLYSFSTDPDQYVLSWFQRTRPAGPVMAVIPLISSHAPWRPVPTLMSWSSLGDGSGYATPTQPLEAPESVFTRPATVVQADYANAISYSLSALFSYVENYGDDNTVLIFLGDHQPAPIVTGDTTNRDAPIAIVSRDAAVMAAAAGWGWSPGLAPSASSPVLRMDTFRDQFLSTFTRS